MWIVSGSEIFCIIIDRIFKLVAIVKSIHSDIDKVFGKGNAFKVITPSKSAVTDMGDGVGNDHTDKR